MNLKTKLEEGKNVYGTAFTSVSPSWSVQLQQAGLDFVFLDTEHISLDRSDLSKLCQLFQAYRISPIVRIPCPDPFIASQAIDAGALGVVAPYLESTKQILDLVGAVKYKPLKGEVLEKVLRGENILNEDMKNYLKKQNGHKLVIANIESVPALDKLDDLLSVPGLDAVFIGPHDLSCSLGLPEMYDHPLFEEAVKTIIHKCRKNNLSVGIHFSLEPERQVRWIKEGVNIIVHSFDICLFSQKLKEDINVIKKSVGDYQEKTNCEENLITGSLII